MTAAGGQAVTLLVIAKEPVPGRVKTRLTPPFTPAQAADLATAAIADTLLAVEALRRSPAGASVRPLLVLDGSAGPWLPTRIDTVPQATGPFDARLAAAFDLVRGPALLIGMDTPQVTPRLLADACSALADADAVLGLAADGGWWALGLRRPAGRLLRGVATSRPDTGARQRERLERAGLRVASLPVLRDVDTAADAQEITRLMPNNRFATALRAARCDGGASDRSARSGGTGSHQSGPSGEADSARRARTEPTPRAVTTLVPRTVRR